MAFNENDRDRNRRGFSQQPSDRDDRNERNRNYGGMGDYDRNRERNYGEGSFGAADNDYNRGYAGGRGDSNFQSNRGDNRYQGGYSGMNEGNRGYGNQDYGYGSSGYDSDRDRGRGDYGFQGNRGGYSGMSEGNRSYGRDNDRGRDFWDKTRDFLDKTKDEVSSWFGDEEADRRRRMDEMRGGYRAGQHRGKGPRGYTRTDERIKEDIHDRLSDDAHVDASDIEVSVNNGEVTLTGTVNSRWEKRHAEDIAESVSGVKHLENRLRVGSSMDTSATEASTFSTGTTGAATSGTAGINRATTTEIK